MKSNEISYDERGRLSKKYQRIWSLSENHITIPELISKTEYRYYLDMYDIYMDKENGTFVLAHILLDNRYSERLDVVKVISFDTVKKLLTNERNDIKTYIEKNTGKTQVEDDNNINGIKERLLKLEEIVKTEPINWRSLLESEK